MVAQALLSGKHGIEVLRIEVQVIDLMARHLQARQHFLVQGRLVTALNGVTKNDKDAHG